jgi:hypothetical protein
MREPALANSVYLHTHQGLAAMVSDRAASRMLDAALRDSGSDQSLVTAEQMSALLLGPVLEELVSILPRQGLELNLETLAASLLIGSMDLEEDSVIPRNPTLQLTPAVPRRKPRRNPTVITGVNTRPVRIPADDLHRLERGLLSLAAIDHVTLVAAVRSDGTVHHARGEGNVELLARFGMLALRML